MACSGTSDRSRSHIGVPLIVALLMVVISAAISERVLNRLSRTQESFLNGLAETYLDGLSSALVPAVLREDVWEVFDTLDRPRPLALAPIETVVTGPSPGAGGERSQSRRDFFRLPKSYSIGTDPRS